MAKSYRGKKLVELCQLPEPPDNEVVNNLSQPIRLNQWPQTVSSVAHLSTKYIESIFKRPYSMDFQKFNETQTSDDLDINKVLSTPKKIWEDMFKPINLKHNQQHITCQKLPELEHRSASLLCYEQMPPSENSSNSDEIGDYDSDDSVKDKDYIPPADMPQNSSDSEENQSIIYSLPPTVQLPLSARENDDEIIQERGLNSAVANEEFVINSPTTSRKLFKVNTQNKNNYKKPVVSKVHSLISLCQNAINKILHREKENLSEENALVVVVQIIGELSPSSPEKYQEVIENIRTENIERENYQDQEHINLENCVENIEEENEQQYTKTGKLRKRKRYDTNLAQRQLCKRKKYMEEHRVQGGCEDNCMKKCMTKFDEEDRNFINNYYLNLSWKEQRVFLKQSSCLATLKRKIATSPKRHPRRTFFFILDEEKIEVCKCFFLTTLGYKKSNDKVLYNALNSEDDVLNDMRGKHSKTSLIDRDPIIQHIQSFNPTTSHYRREHAPNRKYLPSDLTAKLMYEDFTKKNPAINISYDLYRKQIKSLNISFTQLGHEECEICEAHDIHCTAKNHDKENVPVDCKICSDYISHKSRSEKARKLYIKHKAETDPNHIYFSTDLQKVIMLPRLETLKEVVFCQRLVAFNQTFAPVGQSDKKPFAVLWHEAIGGRKQEDLISGFNAFLKHCRDYKVIDLWLDNCGAQNKNWLLYFYIVHIINSNESNTEQINLNYFETGHTFMSCDHFHHQVELSMKRKKKLYDFQDFVDAVSLANSGKVTIQEMKICDFINVDDFSSSRRIQTSNPRAYLRNMVQVTFKRGTFNLFYRNDLDGEIFTLSFLKDTYLKPKNDPPSVITTRVIPRGIKETRKTEILRKLSKFMPAYKQTFWKNLPTSNEQE